MPALPRAALAATALLVLAAGCQHDPASDGRVDVVAAFYPLQFVAERVGGTHVKVVNLVKPGVEPHDLELQPKQMASIVDADLVLYLAGFQPSVDDAVGQSQTKKSLDVAEVEPLHSASPEDESERAGSLDPHVWLDPIRLAAIGDRVAQRLAQIDPANSADYAAGAASLRSDLTALDREYAAQLTGCQRDEIVTSHAAFGYLAERYHLRQVPVTGISPDEEPSPGRLAEVTKLVNADGVTTVFFETLVSPAIAQALARETGTRAEKLDPIEGIEPGSAATYLTVMRDNLRALVQALGCP